MEGRRTRGTKEGRTNGPDSGSPSPPFPDRSTSQAKVFEVASPTSHPSLVRGGRADVLHVITPVVFSYVPSQHADNLYILNPENGGLMYARFDETRIVFCGKTV